MARPSIWLLVVMAGLTVSSGVYGGGRCSGLSWFEWRSGKRFVTDNSSPWRALLAAFNGLEIRPLNAQNPNWKVFRQLLAERTHLESSLEADWEQLTRTLEATASIISPERLAGVRTIGWFWLPIYEALAADAPEREFLEEAIGAEDKNVLSEIFKPRRQLDTELNRFRRVVLRDPPLAAQLLKMASEETTTDELEYYIDWLLYGGRAAWGELSGYTDTAENLRRAGHQTGYGPSRASWIRDMINKLELTDRDIVVDIGSGLGRAVLLGAHLSPAQFVGIEVVPERAEFSRRCRRELGVPNASFVTGDAMAPENRHLFEQATVFYLFNPLSWRDFEQFEILLTHLPPLPYGKRRRVVTVYVNLHHSNYRPLEEQGELSIYSE